MAETTYKRPHQRVLNTPSSPAPAAVKPAKSAQVAAKSQAYPKLSPVPKPRRKAWPILEIVLVLLLLKVAVSAVLMLTGGESGVVDKQAPVEPQVAALPEPVEPEPVNIPPESVLEAGLASTGRIIQSAAVSLTSPSVASAAPAPIAQASGAALTQAVSASSVAYVNSMASGAALVLSEANGVAAAVKTGAPELPPDGIPLPPDSADLLKPASLPNLAPPAEGSQVSGPAPSTGSASVSGQTTLGNMQMYQKEQELARKTAELKTKESALKDLESELDKKLLAIETAKNDIDAIAKRNEAILTEQKAVREQQTKDDQMLKDARIEHLVTAYKSMKPEQAGILVTSMDDDVAVAILSAMPGRNAGQILANVMPDKAARLTKAISEKRIDPKLLLEEAGTAKP